MKISGNVSNLSEQLITGLSKFAEFIEADIEFKDNGNTEELHITKNNETFIIKACGNKIDGGFFVYPQISNQFNKKSEEAINIAVLESL